MGRYCGSYALRNRVTQVTSDGSGRLWLTRQETNEAATMAALAGEHLEPQVRELRRLDGHTFACVGTDGQAAGAVEFLETDARGRARYVHSGRAAPRVD